MNTSDIMNIGIVSNIGLPIEVWCLIMNNLNYYSIRFATVSKTFYNNIVYHCITDLSTLCSHCFMDILFNFKPQDLNDEFVQRFVNLKVLDSYPYSRNHYYVFILLD